MNKTEAIKENYEFVQTGKAYAVLGGVLAEVTINQIKVDADGVTYVTDKGELAGVTKFYKSPDAYERGRECDKSTLASVEYARMDGYISTQHSNPYLRFSEEDGFYIDAYEWLGFEPRQVKYHIAECVVDGNYIADIEIEEGNPAECYGSREDAFLFNEYDVVHDNGVTEHIVGMGKRTRITPEQRTALNWLETAFADCKKAGIGFLIDTDQNELHAYNDDGKAIYGDWESHPDDRYELPMGMTEEIKADIEAFCFYDGPVLYLEQK